MEEIRAGLRRPEIQREKKFKNLN
ncbi:hypothetical protein CLS_22580 [[Clostridium] cf. saccharolyticum K10]|nr:hypothetical protein CLS_22580 [[Clostridium] cf. saccharolyticum K10]